MLCEKCVGTGAAIKNKGEVANETVFNYFEKRLEVSTSNTIQISQCTEIFGGHEISPYERKVRLIGVRMIGVRLYLIEEASLCGFILHCIKNNEY